MEVKKFSDLDDSILNIIIDKHFSHWSKYSEFMKLEDTKDKFRLYANNNEIPYGIAMFDKEELIGFCVFKENCLDKYPQFTPWISDVMIFDDYRGRGNGRKLIEFAKKELKSKGFNKAYLWTDKAPKFYEKIGFTYVQDVIKNHDDGIGKLYMIEL